MYLFYCDESNLETRAGDFFVYGGLAIPTDNALALSREIEQIRNNAQIPSTFILKFNPGPEHLSHQEFIEVKQAVLEAAARADTRLITSFLSHDIATNPNEARRNEINRVCYHFNCLLARDGEKGLVLIDRFNDQQIDAHLREKFSIGITDMPYQQQMRLERILGFHYSAIGQSHFPSVVDIVLGSMRFCINIHTRRQVQLLDTARNLMALLAELYMQDEASQIPEIALFFSPKVINVRMYRERYESLKQFLTAGGLDAAQSITSQRQY